LCSDPLHCDRMHHNCCWDSRAYAFIQLFYPAADHSFIHHTRGLENIYKHLKCSYQLISRIKTTFKSTVLTKPKTLHIH
jgi:hypothetical protein